ncbi:MAG TPA: lysophospholipid acyltransferase family protein [Vicinamibacterales bacterium]|nr:lysophospholipid acyltransferase family protein [Vicinamibacterales bacterium]
MASSSRSNDWRTSASKRFQAKLISILGYRAISALASTYRWKTEGLEHYDAIVKSGHQPVMAFWHGRILSATYYFRRRGIVVITSENFDGEWIAGIIERFGYGTARGSTSRGARKAMLQLVRDMAAGKPAGFTLDGPRGPARVAQPGAVWLAKMTGNPVLPFHLEADRAWTMNSWDRTQIPKPFATVSMAMGEPFTVAADADDAGLDAARRDLEARLSALETRAQSLLVNP